MADSAIEWLAEATEGQAVLARVGRRGDRLIADWTGLGRLVVGRDGSTPTFVPHPNAGAVQLAKLEHGAIRVLLRSLEGKIGLHGAAVSVAGRGVVLLGRSRDGKSTLAAAICAGRDGALLADDAVALDHGPSGWGVVPSEAVHFLGPDAIAALGLAASEHRLANAKAAVSTTVAAHPAPLAAVVRLVFDDTCARPVVRRLGPIDAIGALVPQTIRFAIDEPARHRAELARLADLVARVPAFELTRRRSLPELEATADCVMELLSGVET